MHLGGIRQGPGCFKSDLNSHGSDWFRNVLITPFDQWHEKYVREASGKQKQKQQMSLLSKEPHNVQSLTLDVAVFGWDSWKLASLKDEIRDETRDEKNWVSVFSQEAEATTPYVCSASWDLIS